MNGRRSFDWDEARRLRAEGMTYTAIGRRFGVSDSAVYYACNDAARARMIAAASEWQRGGSCIDCGSPCIRGAASRNGRCRACAARERATSVRDAELRCSACREWKPDSDFPLNRDDPARRGRHGSCRPCLTAAKRAYRKRTQVPCSHGCGRLVDGKNRRNPEKPPECLSCATRRTSAERKQVVA